VDLVIFQTKIEREQNSRRINMKSIGEIVGDKDESRAVAPMKRITIGLLVGALAVAMLVPQARAAETPDPLVMSDFDWKPGQICTYDAVHNGKKARWHWEVSEVSGSQMNAVWTKVGSGSPVTVPQVQIQSESGINWTRDMNLQHATPMSAEQGFNWIAFPLAPKSKWKSSAVVSGTGADGKPWKVKTAFSSKADKRWKKVKTPAGEFLTLKVVSKESITGLSASFRGTGRATFWIGRGNCLVKKIQYSNSFKESASLTLVSEKAP